MLPGVLNIQNHLYYNEDIKTIFHYGANMRYLKIILFIALMSLFFTESPAQRSTWRNPDLEPANTGSSLSLEPIEVKPSVIVKGKLGVDVLRICQYQMAYTDKGSGGDQDVTFYTPIVPPGFSMIGGYAQGNYWNPSDCIIAVKPDNNPQSNQLLKSPADWQQVWTDRNSGAKSNGSIWHPVSPDQDYVCLGSIAVQGYNKPSTTNYSCIHKCLTESVPSTNYIWSDKGTGAGRDVSIYKLHNSNGFYAIPGYNRPPLLEDIKGNPVCNF